MSRIDYTWPHTDAGTVEDTVWRSRATDEGGEGSRLHGWTLRGYHQLSDPTSEGVCVIISDTTDSRNIDSLAHQ